MSSTDAMQYTPPAEPAQVEDRTLYKTAVRDSRNSTVIYNARAIEGSRSDQRMVGHFKKLFFSHKYKDLPEEQKEAQYLLDLVEEFKFKEVQDTARLHQLRTAAHARQYDALQALPKFGVATYSNVKETDPELAEKVIRGWAYLLEGQNGQEALCEARKELDGIVEGANPPPRPERKGARKCFGVSEADEALVSSLCQLPNVQICQALCDAQAKGSKVTLVDPDHRELTRRTEEAWFELLMEAKDEDARQPLRDAIRAHLAGNPPSPSTPPKLDRQPGFKGTPPPPAPVPALVEETPPPLALPEMTRTHDVPQTTWAFEELAPAEQTPDAKPPPEAPPEVQHPTLTVNVAVANVGNGAATASKNLEAALKATEAPVALTQVDHELNAEPGPPAKVARTMLTRALKTKLSDY